MPNERLRTALLERGLTPNELAVGTVGAFVVGFVLLRREHRREADRAEDERRAQAARISGHPGRPVAVPIPRFGSFIGIRAAEPDENAPQLRDLLRQVHVSGGYLHPAGSYSPVFVHTREYRQSR